MSQVSSVWPSGTREARHVGAVALGELDVAALGDQQGVVAGLGQLAPDLTHLGRGLEVVAVAVEGEPLARAVTGRDVHRRPGVDAEQVLLAGCVLAHDVVGVVGGQQRDLQVLGQPEQPLTDPGLDVDAVVHQLEEVVVPAEDVLVVRGCLPGRVVVVVAQVDLDLARRTPGGRDQALAVPGQELAVDARLLEEAVAPRTGAEPEEVVHPLGRLAEQRHVRVGAASRDVVGPAAVEVDALALEAADVGCGVGLDADDRLDPGLPWPTGRTRRPRTRCRGRSSRSPASRALPPAGSGRPTVPHRRAWSTRCARAGGRTSPGRAWVWWAPHRIVGACEQS